MITDFLIGVWADFLTWVVGLLPAASDELNEGLEVAHLQLGQVLATIEPFEVFLPLAAFFQAAVLVLGAVMIQIALRLGRIVASFATLGGGM